MEDGKFIKKKRAVKSIDIDYIWKYIYLHYALEKWIEIAVKKNSK